MHPGNTRGVLMEYHVLRRFIKKYLRLNELIEFVLFLITLRKDTNRRERTIPLNLIASLRPLDTPFGLICLSIKEILLIEL